jgi:single stranded DNA-binding protein
MAFARVEQRNARLASAVKVEVVKGRDGEVVKGTVTVISNTRRGSGDDRAEEATAIQWTLWGKQAENAAEYLGKGSRVNVVGRLRNNNYTDAGGVAVYGFQFTCDELDYLDSKSETEARRRSHQEWTEAYDRADATATDQRGRGAVTGRSGNPGRRAKAA